jgi:hypothetical protein
MNPPNEIEDCTRKTICCVAQIDTYKRDDRYKIKNLVNKPNPGCTQFNGYTLNQAVKSLTFTHSVMY